MEMSRVFGYKLYTFFINIPDLFQVSCSMKPGSSKLLKKLVGSRSVTWSWKCGGTSSHHMFLCVLSTQSTPSWEACRKLIFDQPTAILEQTSFWFLVLRYPFFRILRSFSFHKSLTNNTSSHNLKKHQQTQKNLQTNQPKTGTERVNETDQIPLLKKREPLVRLPTKMAQKHGSFIDRSGWIWEGSLKFRLGLEICAFTCVYIHIYIYIYVTTCLLTQ